MDTKFKLLLAALVGGFISYTVPLAAPLYQRAVCALYPETCSLFNTPGFIRAYAGRTENRAAEVCMPPSLGLHAANQLRIAEAVRPQMHTRVTEVLE